MEVAIPKLRQGSYFPDWLLDRRRRAERALTTVVATCYLLGVSTRRMEKLVETLGITRRSKSQVSNMAKELDEHVADFRSRPLDAGPYTFVAPDALVLKVREGGRVVNVHALPCACMGFVFSSSPWSVIFITVSGYSYVQHLADR
jgi:putative transposase